jgi:hypothetical protein
MGHDEMGGEMRWFPGGFAALLILMLGGSGEALAACCVSYTPVHVYVPPPTHVVVVPHTTYVPHTSYVRPGTTQVHTRAPGNTGRTSTSSTSHTGEAKPKPHPVVVAPVVVGNEGTSASTRCKGQQSGEGCKKKGEEPTGWARVRQWLQIGKQ